MDSTNLDKQDHFDDKMRITGIPILADSFLKICIQLHFSHKYDAAFHLKNASIHSASLTAFLNLSFTFFLSAQVSLYVLD